MVAVLSFVVLLPVFVGAGDRWARLLGLRPGPLVERVSLAYVLSAGAVTGVGFLLAVCHRFTSGACLGLAGVFALAALGPLREGLSAARGLPGRPALWPRGGIDRILVLGIAAFLGLGAIVALAPPTGMDTGIYHFTIPKVIVQEHGLVSRDDLWIHKSGGFYLLYAFGMALGGEILAKLLGFAMAVAGVGLAASVAERLKSGTGPAAAFLVVSTPLGAGYLGYEYLELPVLSYVLGATLALLREREGRIWTGLACVLAGLAVSVKPSAFEVALLAPVALWLLLRRERAGGIPAAAISLAAFAAAAGFWSLWNYRTTGSLFYRYAGLPEGPGASAAMPPLWKGVAHLLGIVGTTGQYWTDSAGPFIVAGLAGFLWFAWASERRLAAVLCLLSIAVFVGGLAVLAPSHLFSDFSPRYLAPGLVGFGAPAAAQFVGWVRERPGLLRKAVMAALLLPAAPLLVLKSGRAAVAAPAAFGLESRSAYLGSKIETFAACEELNRLPPGRVKVLFVAVRPYYLDQPFVWIPYTGEVPFLRGVKSRADFLARLREQGFTHVLYEPSPVRDPWFSDPDSLFGPPFRLIGRWPWKDHDWVRLYAVEAP